MIRERYEASQKGTILANTMSKGGMRTGRQSHLTHWPAQGSGEVGSERAEQEKKPLNLLQLPLPWCWGWGGEGI